MEKMDISANHAFKFRIYPTEEQMEILEASFRLKLYVFNFFLGRQMAITIIIKLEYFNSIFGGNVTFDYLNDNKFKSFILNGEELKLDKQTEDDLKEYLKKVRKEEDLYFDKYKAYGIFKKYMSEHPEKFEFVKKTNTTTIAETLSSLDLAFKNMKKTNAGYPKFKKRYSSSKSYSGNFSFVNGVNQTFSLKHKEKDIRYNHNDDFKKCRASVVIPSSKFKIHKLGEIEIIVTSEFFLRNWADPNKMMIKNFTVSRDVVGNYFISFGCCLFEKKNTPTPKPILHERSIGIDCNIANITTTDIEINENPSFKMGMEYKEMQKKIDAETRKLSNKIRGSNQYKKKRKKINKIHVRLTNKRSYNNNIISKTLVSSEKYDVYVLEDLNIKNMVKRTKNETEREKQNTKDKRSLRRSIHNAMWGGLKTQIERKAKESGKHVIKVNPSYTSRTCSICGYNNKRQSLKDRVWTCPECGTTHCRDYNASINIKNRAF